MCHEERGFYSITTAHRIPVWLTYRSCLGMGGLLILMPKFSFIILGLYTLLSSIQLSYWAFVLYNVSVSSPSPSFMFLFCFWISSPSLWLKLWITFLSWPHSVIGSDFDHLHCTIRGLLCFFSLAFHFWTSFFLFIIETSVLFLLSKP